MSGIDANILDDSTRLLREMVAIPSPSFEEEKVCDAICARLEEFGIEASRYGNNIVCICGEGGKGPVLVLDAHIDTVPPCLGYTKDPYDPGKDEDTVFGLGSNDDGGSVVAMIAAFRHILSKGTVGKGKLILVLSCEEERSGKGGARFIYGPEGPFAKGELPKPDAVIVGEPTGLEAATSERGLLVLDCEARGKSGHAARGEGVNALYIALEDIQKMRSHKFTRISELMGEVRLSVTQINAGTAHNVIPDICSFVADIRPNELYTNEEILCELQAECRSALKARNLTNRSSATPSDSPLMRSIRDCGIKTFSSPTTSDWMRIPYPAVKIGPGMSERSHKADEYIKIDEIRRGAALYADIIEKFYGNSMEQGH